MGIKVKVSPQIVRNMSKVYQSTSRIFMEYIDNSLDSAEKLIHSENRHSYQYQIEIEIEIDSKNKVVTFKDNCTGMDEANLLRIAENIGNSDKKNDFITNGQFGFGIHAYSACASDLEITTLTLSSDSALKINIDRDAYQDDGEIKNIIEIDKDKVPLKSGTIVTITGFDKEWWKEVNVHDLKKEIEKHFEQILKRQNLEIKIISDNKETICKTFDYDSYPGVKIEKEVTELEDKKGIKIINKNIKIYLKITDDIIPGKRPIFVTKGRRIEEIQSIKSFRNRSEGKTGVWGHNNLTGYIDINGELSPTIARDDFERSHKRSLIYDVVLKEEKDIADYLKELNKELESTNMTKFQDIISSALAKLAKEDNLRFRTGLSKGDDINLLEDPDSEEFIDGEKKKGGGGNKPTKKDQLEKIPVIETEDDSDLKGKKNRKSGFDIEFSKRDPKLADGTLIRSDYSDGTPVYIYMTHPDFQERVKRTNQGTFKITERLVSYIAIEIAINYKHKFFEQKGQQPQVQEITNSRRNLFVDIAEFTYKLEQALQPCVDKDLLTLETLNNDE